MFLRPVFLGVLAAVLVALPRWIWMNFSNIDWSAPVFLFGVTFFVIVLKEVSFGKQVVSLSKRAYTGIADLLVHVHSPPKPGSSERWALRGAISFLLTLFGGNVGVEGAAIEAGHGIAIKSRSRSTRWFEQLRRTDVSCTLAGAVAAAFGAPFAAIVLPYELRIGGSTRPPILSALSGFITIRYIERFLSLPSFDLSGLVSKSHGLGPKNWDEAFFILGVVAAVVFTVAVIVLLVKLARESFTAVFEKRVWMGLMVGGAALYLIALIYPDGHEAAPVLLKKVLDLHPGVAEIAVLFLSQFLILLVVVAVFASSGILWPVFAVGAFVGYAIAAGLSVSPALGMLIGGSALWGALFGAPLAGALLAFEMGQDLGVLLPALLTTFLANEVRKVFKLNTLLFQDLTVRGLTLDEGRSVSVLKALTVQDAMVTDFQVVHERDSVSRIAKTLGESKYPFLPVIKSGGKYAGLLTADLIQEAAQKEKSHSNSSLLQLLEAKDLLYRSGATAPTVLMDDKLTVTTGIFNETPVVPVLSHGRQVVGLLFHFNVRIEYDKEVARRTLAFKDVIATTIQEKVAADISGEIDQTKQG